MAITFVAAGANGDNGSVGSGNPTAPGIPAGMQAGDFMLLVVHSCDNVTTSTPTGWTLKQAQNAGTALRQTIFWRRWQSGDGAPTIAHTAGDACQARIYGFRGVSTTAADPIEAIASQTGSGSATVTAATITTVSDGAAVVGAWAEEVTGNTSGSPTWASYSGTNPTFAEIGDNGVDNLNANELGVGVAWGTVTPANTSTGTRTAVVTNPAGTVTNSIGTLLALSPPGSTAGWSPAPLRPPMANVPGMFLRSPPPWDNTQTSSSYTDSAAGQLTLGGSRTESTSMADSGAGQIRLSGSNTEAFKFTETPAGKITLGGAKTESASIADSAAGKITLGGASSNTLLFTETAAGQIRFSGARSDGLLFLDTASGTIRFSGFSRESASIADSAAGKITLGGSSTENFISGTGTSYTDSAAGLIRLSGQVVRTGEYQTPTQTPGFFTDRRGRWGRQDHGRDIFWDGRE